VLLLSPAGDVYGWEGQCVHEFGVYAIAEYDEAAGHRSRHHSRNAAAALRTLGLGRRYLSLLKLTHLPHECDAIAPQRERDASSGVTDGRVGVVDANSVPAKVIPHRDSQRVVRGLSKRCKATAPGVIPIRDSVWSAARRARSDSGLPSTLLF